MRAPSPRPKRGLAAAVDAPGARRGIDDDGARGLAELRRVILGPERTRIGDLEQRSLRLEKRAVSVESVAEVLPEAVGLATSRRDRDLGAALEPTVVRAVAGVARSNPELYGEILAPTIGTAVKKAVRDALAAMMERFNVTLERSLSVEGIRWRMEAARTGCPLAEVALLHTLQYRVEQVFLIHTPTALVLEHATDPVLTEPSPDQVAALLTAIDAFAREALAPGPDDHLERVDVGDLVVYVSRDPSITVAVVVRGTPSEEMAQRIAEARARIGASRRPELLAFHGDVAPFAAVRPELDALLVTERRPPRGRARPVLVVLGACLALALVAGVAWRTSLARARSAYVAALVATPGIVVTNVDWSDGRGRITGLRDPRASRPEDIVARPGVPRLAAPAFDLVPFVSADPRLGGAGVDPGGSR